MGDEVFLVVSTFPDEETAARIGTALVTEKLAACANILSGIRSIFSWEGKMEDTAETIVFFKTTGDRLPALQQKLSELHPYDVPEMIALRVADGLPAYLRWVAESCRA